MGLVYQYFMFAGKSSEDFETRISGSGTFISPAREVESFQVPGKNGDLHIDSGRYSNITITYPAYITHDFEQNYNALKAFLLSHTGYEELADTYHREHFRLARAMGNITPQMTTLNREGSFELSFDCDPRLFLKKGKETRELTASAVIINPTRFRAKPLMRVYGTGTVTIGNTAVTINSASVYTDIDCELEEAYKGSTNCNGNITLASGKFPALEPGNNNIYLSGVSKVELTPRWWTL